MLQSPTMPTDDASWVEEGRAAEPDRSRKYRRRDRDNIRLVGKQVDRLLRLEMGDYQQKLNRELIRIIMAGFDRWLLGTRNELLSQLERIPEHARGRWLDERLAASGLSREWFEDKPLLPTLRRGQRDDAGVVDERRPENQGSRLLTDFLLYHSEQLVTELKRLRSGNQAFRSAFAAAEGKSEREQAIFRYAQQLGASRRKLAGDRAALSRWFDEEAVNDRYTRQLGELELLLSFVMNRLGVLVRRVNLQLRESSESKTSGKDLWKRLSFEKRITLVAEYQGDTRVRVAALTCLHDFVRSMDPDEVVGLLSPRVLASLTRIALRGNADAWVQCAAIDILILAKPEEAAATILRRLRKPGDNDDFFVRRHLLRSVEARALAGRPLKLELPPTDNEPSEFVRQRYARLLYLSERDEDHRRWCRLAQEDSVPQVRAAGLLAAADLPHLQPRRFDVLEVIAQSIRNESDPFVVRVALHVAVCFLKSALASGPDDESERTLTEFYRQRMLPSLEELIARASRVPIRRWAVQTNERLWAMLDPAARDFLRRFESEFRSIPVGTTRRFKPADFQAFSDEQLARLLAVIAIDDFGFDVHRRPWGIYITRGPVFGFRCWRLVHEFSHAATDKRQGIRHTIGRINASPIRVMSQICGELSETKVPGEPLTIAADGTWRPYLPLLDDFVAVLNQSWFGARPIRFFSSQGVTTVTAPKSIVGRTRAAILLTWQFESIARTRNWDDDTYAPSSYVTKLRELGFDVKIQGYEGGPVGDDSVTRFFASGKPDPKPAGPSPSPAIGLAMLGGLNLSDTASHLFNRFRQYFSSAFENSLEHLLLFATAATLFVIGKHARSNYRLFKARRSIPLSIGGWGTRGKSGTERLKAALIGAVGHGLVSKTTGCEAMFIHADPYADPLEVPLFRPFDKATIWEQSNLIRNAARMKPSVFLWECMALTPSYVDVLQRQWTRDDLATITNTYPDHEDLQGPAGHNVATTISGFVPLQSRLLSTEEQMRPYVTDSCRTANTSFRGVGWLESGLITDDVLQRFPYREHPDNVALVAAMGEELGIEYEYSLKAMGDYLVPDLGVLKTHPVAEVRGRKIEFTNGMSANERFGCMGNWKRLGFDKQDPWQEPAVWVSGVVNNRADRVPRSKVFAKIIVEDMNADRFFLIGNNLKGLKGFIDEAWEEKAATITLRSQNDRSRWNVDHAVKTLRQAAGDYRQPTEDEHVREKLHAMMQAIAPQRDVAEAVDGVLTGSTSLDKLSEAETDESVTRAARQHHADLETALSEFRAMEQRIRDANADEVETVETEFVTVLRTWFYRKLVVIEKYESTGEEVLFEIVENTPPGFLNRVIGLQNIKGTGLDFVYRFQAWDVCFEACQHAVSRDASRARRGLEALVAMPQIGQLCEAAIRNVIREGRASKTHRRSELQALLQSLEDRLDRGDEELPVEDAARESETAPPTAASKKRYNDRTESDSNWNEWMNAYGQEYEDMRDSLTRRDEADMVYRDLAEQRIGRQRAISVLRGINKRQKQSGKKR